MLKFALSIKTCLGAFDKAAWPDEFRQLYQKAFERILASLEKTVQYSKELKERVSKTDVDLITSTIDILTRAAFEICLDSTSGKDLTVWSAIYESYQKLCNNETFVQVWQISMLSLTENLIVALREFSKEEFAALSEVKVLPFRGLPMKGEYALQVVFNAFSAKDDDKFFEVMQLKVYTDYFECWMRLLNLFQVKIELTDGIILLKYLESKSCIYQ